ncbi:MAG: Uma2 family endonuclease [Pirellulaceae bacterium]|nr:Uma2 family endonuclease [Pirellulaceae bacterium]
MIQKTDSLVDELYRVEGKAEIVDGRIVRMNAAGGWHGWVGNKISASLAQHEETHGGGIAFGDNVGFLVDLPRRKSFSPDAAWMPGSPDDLTLKFIDGAPSFAVEVRSENDYGPAAEKRILRKIKDYFAAGTRVVWDVDLLSDDVIKSYRAASPDTPQVFRAGDHADAEPAVPNWRFAVKKLVRS